MNTDSSRTHADDDSHDQIGTGSATPSGVATPHPDPTDKRLPGILHTYFGQVRERPFTAPSDQNPSPCIPLAPGMDTLTQTTKFGPGATGGAALPTAPSTPGETDPEAPQSLTLGQAGFSQQVARLNRLTVSAYPTPPSSSSSSSKRKSSEGDSDGSLQPREVGIFKASRPSFSRHSSGNIVMPLRMHRQTASLNPLSNVTTSSNVHAANISNPASSTSSTGPSTPTRDVPANSALSSLASHLESAKLTDDVVPPREKNTPPHTPRALSSDGSETAKHAPSTPEQGHDNARQSGATTSSPPRSSTHVNPPRGKLSVTISEARGLRPSYSPYAVCAFEWIESIARGPKQGDAEAEPQTSREQSLGGGIPIQRSGSDMGGRSMAIPMKSRQSSTTSLKDVKDFKNGRQVTDPKWDHTGVL